MEQADTHKHPTLFEEVRDLVADSLQLTDRAGEWTMRTELLGAIPEFDSMSVVHVVTAIEEQYDVVVEDDDISAETFETLGSLVDFVASKLA